ncbi:hypothetical protein [Paradesulfitobacterium aromaticivorans]
MLRSISVRMRCANVRLCRVSSPLFTQSFLGLLKPQAGKVILNGQDIAGVSTHELAKTVGILFQNPDDQLFNARVDEEIAWSIS